MAYQIRVQGHLEHKWADWLDDLVITHTTDGESHLLCRIHDQAALHGLVNRLSAHNVTLLSLVRPERQRATSAPGASAT